MLKIILFTITAFIFFPFSQTTVTGQKPIPPELKPAAAAKSFFFEQKRPKTGALQSALRNAFRSSRLKRGWQIGGRTLTVVTAGADSVSLRDTRRCEDLEFTYAEIPARWQSDLLALVRRRKPALLLELATVAFDQDRPILAREFLADATAADAKLFTAAAHLYSKRSGKTAPDKFAAPAKDKSLAEAYKAAAAIKKAIGRAGRKFSAKNRAAVEAAVKKLAGMGADGTEIGLFTLAALRDAEIESAENTTGLRKEIDELAGLKSELNKLRTHALKLIEDETAWPYPYAATNERTAADVMRRIERVREVWNSKTSLKGRKTKKPGLAIERLTFIESRMALLADAGAGWSAVDQTYLSYVGLLANQPLTVRNFATSAEELERINWSLSVQAENAATAAKNGKNSRAPSLKAWKQLSVTNQYRTMMGRHALKMNFKLYWAAQHHSRYCVEFNRNQIAHVIAGEPRGATPGERILHEGYQATGGENLAFVPSPTAKSVHDGWLHSSAHHRNIIRAKWRVMGNGNYRSIWTQIFAAVDEGDENSKSKGGR